MEADPFDSQLMTKLFFVLVWFAVLLAIILPVAWFFLPSAEARREAGLRRPAEPETIEEDFRLFRGIYVLAACLLWPCFVIYFAPATDLSPHEKLMNLTTTLAPVDESSTAIPTIMILANGEVVFMELRLPAEDHDLDTLQVRLRDYPPLLKKDELVFIQPEPEITHQRVIEVLSAVQRAGLEWVLQ